MSLIDVNELRNRLQNLSYDDWNQGVSTSWAEAYSEIADMINNAPTIEAEPVRHGRWEDKKVAFYLKCSECGATVRKNLYDVFLDCDIRDLNYCPHCGARMDAEND